MTDDPIVDALWFLSLLALLIAWLAAMSLLGIGVVVLVNGDESAPDGVSYALVIMSIAICVAAIFFVLGIIRSLMVY